MTTHHPEHNTSSAEEYDQDLARSQRPAEEAGLGAEGTPGAEASASDFKELRTTLADLTNDELKNVPILPTGTRLEQGSKYIDLNHLEQGEFVAQGIMIASPEHAYVPKKETDYVLWNRLNQVDSAARLDEE